jgi:hypothetical protein
MKVHYDYKNLRTLMRQQRVSCDELARVINATPVQLSYKLSGRLTFTTVEIALICERLGVPLCDSADYFGFSVVGGADNV